MKPQGTVGPTTVGPYELMTQLDGNVDMERWLARSPAGPMIVEVWTAADVGLRADIAAEARASMVLDHANVARVIGAGESEAPPAGWIALSPEMSDDLHVLTPLPPRFAARVLHDAAQALAYAHGVGRVHGALSGHYVLVGYDGVVRVSGFGAARVASKKRVDSGAVAPGIEARLSPELRRGDPVTPASDVFALGRLLASSVGDAQSLPMALRAVHQQCMEDEPSSRLPSATAFASAVQDAAQHELGSLPTAAELAAYLRDAYQRRHEERERQWAAAAPRTTAALAPITFNVPRDPSNPGSAIPIFDASITSLFVRERSGAEASDPMVPANTITGTWAALSTAFPQSTTPSGPSTPAAPPARPSMPPHVPREDERDGATVQVVGAMIAAFLGAFVAGAMYVGPAVQARLSETARVPVSKGLAGPPTLPALTPPDPAMWSLATEGSPAPTPAPSPSPTGRKP